MKALLETKYRVIIYWEGKLYIGIALKWGYEKLTSQLSMPGHVRTSIHYFQHEIPKLPQE